MRRHRNKSDKADKVVRELKARAERVDAEFARRDPEFVRVSLPSLLDLAKGDIDLGSTLAKETNRE
jgi:hypothetical protein